MSKELSIIFIVLISITLISLEILSFILVVTWERKRRIKKLKINLGIFSPTSLRRRMELYSENTKMKKDIIDIELKIREFERRDYKRIKKDLDNLLKLSNPSNFIKFLQFTNEYNNIISSITKYEKDYLSIRFTLSDLTSDVEIENAIFKKIKENFSNVKKLINNSPENRIRESNKLENKISRIQNIILKFEKESKNKTKHLSPEFVNNIIKIENAIIALNENVKFMNKYTKHIEDDIKTSLSKITDLYNKNKLALIEVNEFIKNTSKQIVELKNFIKEDIKNLKMKKVKNDIIILDGLIFELELIIKSNIDYYSFNNKNENITNILLQFINENSGLFTSEIKRYKTNEEKNKLILIDDNLQSFTIAIKKFEKEKMNRINKYSPQGINKELMNVVYEYENYINSVKQNVKDISIVNTKTNDANKIISHMNTSLLQIEHNINLLPTALRDRFNIKKEEEQIKVTKLRDDFRENTILPSEEILKKIEKLKLDIDNLVDATKGTAFEMYVLKEIIMFLNKNRGSNPEFDKLLDSMSKSYSEEKITESLRKAKNIVEIYGIK